MKRYLFFILCFSGTPFVNAQVFHGGLMGGIGVAEISGDQVWGPNKPGIYIGSFINTGWDKRSTFQFEMAYIQKGSLKSPNPNTGDYDTYKLKLNYVELLANYRYKYKPRIMFEGGLSLGFLIKHTEELNGLDIEDDRKWSPVDFCGNIGILFILSDKLHLNCRYSNSLIRVRPHKSGQVYRLNRGEYNEVLSFTVMYVIRAFK
ncbi:MAG: outer membrane beta-barrel protein [Bacteroidales bacterium]|nr:outer membrane beta-barrel protein [Bacteroidales bacterium]